MELDVFNRTRKDAIESAVFQAAVLFNHFRWKVWDGVSGLVVPGDKRIREILEELVESAEAAFKRQGEDYPVRVASARMSVTVWPFDDSVAYMINFDLSEWDDSDEEDSE